MVTSPDGVRLAVTRTGAGSPLVLVGGAGGDHTAWDAVVPFLSRSHTVHALDRRGRGGSDDRVGSEVDDEVADVMATCVAAGGEVVLAGHSSGALLALRAARPGVVRRVVAYEPPAVFTPGVAQRLRSLVAAGDLAGALTLFRTAAVGLPAAVVGAMRETPQWQEDLALAHTTPYDAAIVEAGFPEVSVPVRLVLGGASPARMATGVRRYAARVGAEVRVLPGQQHFAQRTAPGELAAAIL
ncbi:alpha/beta hydrolase [Amycolatopsis rhabdoformis]|uniref:Alpha/beta hydrolase n=1 Tax=Amycolatopsis rhabdoformis TaxID=1448059 RepID=A0ABZ1HZS5_9PSEU|nr:alpha/beta hydrolase [Amycolatopsis rhabdoformis]WSE26899.1 alpha/beta hydrolase [Amycolatopsis rhabdoformis]